MKHCLKQVVTATIYDENDDILVVAYNDISNMEVTECPRADLKTGEGYELCTSVCGQKGHAEVQAVNKAINMNIDLSECYMILTGHYYICDPCQEYMKAHGLTNWKVEEC